MDEQHEGDKILHQDSVEDVVREVLSSSGGSGLPADPSRAALIQQNTTDPLDGLTMVWAVDSEHGESFVTLDNWAILGVDMNRITFDETCWAQLYLTFMLNASNDYNGFAGIAVGASGFAADLFGSIPGIDFRLSPTNTGQFGVPICFPAARFEAGDTFWVLGSAGNESAGTITDNGTSLIIQRLS